MHGLTKRAWRKSGKLVTTSTPGRVYGGVIYSKKPDKPKVDTGGNLGKPMPLQERSTSSQSSGPTDLDGVDSKGRINAKPKRKQKPPTSQLVSEKQIISYAEVLQTVLSALVQKQLPTLWNSESFAKMNNKSAGQESKESSKSPKNASLESTSSSTETKNPESHSHLEDDVDLQSNPEKEKEKEKGVAAFAARAIEDLFGLETLDGIYTPSRVQRMAAGITGEQIRLAIHRREVVEGLLAFNRGEIERKEAPGKHVEKRNTQRQINAYVKKYDKLPLDFFELEPVCPLNITPTIPLSTVDDVYTFWQLPKESSVGTTATGEKQNQTKLVLSLCLPTKSTPSKKSDWSWVSVEMGINNEVVTSYLTGDILLCLPTLQVSKGKLKAMITIDKRAPVKVLDPRIALSFDWGSKKFLTGALLWEGHDTVIRTSGPQHMFVFQASKYLAKDYQRQLRAQYLRAKIIKFEQNKENTTSLVEKARLSAKIEKYTIEAQNIDSKRKNANKELARLAARWVVSQALAFGAGLVVVENLDSMEPAFDKKQRNKLSQLIRGMLRDALKIACAQAGIIFKEVNPDYTSKICFSCGAWLSFKTAPNGKSGYAWAKCGPKVREAQASLAPQQGCGLSYDRDYGAAVNIGVRELRNPGTGEIRTYTGHEPNSYQHDLGGVVTQRIKKGNKIPKKRTSKVHKVRKTRVRTRAGKPVQTTQSEQNTTVNSQQTVNDVPTHAKSVLPEVSTTPEKVTTPNGGSVSNKAQSKKIQPTPGVKPDYQDRNRRKSRRSNSVCTVPRPGNRASEVPVVHRWVRRTSSEAELCNTATPSESSASSSPQTAQPPPLSKQESARVLVRVLDGMRYAHRHSINCTPVRLPYDDFELVGRQDVVLSGLSNKV